MTSRGVLGDVRRRVHRDADICCVQGECVVHAVTQESNVTTAAPLDAHNASLLFRADPGEHRGRRDGRRKLLVIEFVEVGAGQRSALGEAEVMANFDSDSRVVARHYLHRDAETGQAGQRPCRVALGCIQEDEEADERQPVLVRRRHRACVGRRAGSQRYHAVTSGEFCLQRRARIGRDVGTTLQDRLGSALGHQCPDAATIADQRGRHASFVIERQARDGAITGQARALAGGRWRVPQCLVQLVAANCALVFDGHVARKLGPVNHGVGPSQANGNGAHEADVPIGQGSGLVREEHVDVAEILDAHQPFHENLSSAHPPRSGRQACGHDGR